MTRTRVASTSAAPTRPQRTKKRPARVQEDYDDEQDDLEQKHREEEQSESPPKKKKRTQKESEEVKPAKRAKQPKEPAPKRVDRFGRTVVYRKTASGDVQARIERALGVGAGYAHRLFLIDTRQVRPPGSEGGGSQEFTVLGATGNVYTVEIGCHPSCTCPDHRKGNICKHILFCFLRVLHRGRTDPLIWQKALLPAEADAVLGVLGSGAVDQTALANERVRARYAEATHTQLAVPSSQAAGGAAGGGAGGAGGAQSKQRPIEGDCPVCYEAMRPNAEAVVFCQTCGNNVHQTCFDMWAKSKRERHVDVTCVWCRAKWRLPGDAGSPAGVHQVVGGFGRTYLNLTQEEQEDGDDGEGGAGVSQPDLYDLYGSSADFILAHQGAGNLRRAIANQQHL